MGRIDDALSAAGGFGMGCHFAVAVADADPPAGDHDAHRFADQPPRHAVGVGVDLDRAIGLHPAHQLADLSERRAAVDWLQRVRLGASETRNRRLSGGAVIPAVGDLALPPGEMRFQRRPADEGVPGDGVVLDVADAALVLALGARAVGRTGPGPEPPVVGEGVQPLVEADFAGHRIVAIDQGAGIVEQHLPRHSAKMTKRALDPVEPR